MNKTESKSRYVYGLAGLAQLIGCSKPTALKIKDSGKIPFGKIGKKFIFNEEAVMAAISNEGGRNA
jgi:excisionase family DNA binding protein